MHMEDTEDYSLQQRMAFEWVVFLLFNLCPPGVLLKPHQIESHLSQQSR